MEQHTFRATITNGEIWGWKVESCPGFPHCVFYNDLEATELIDEDRCGLDDWLEEVGFEMVEGTFNLEFAGTHRFEFETPIITLESGRIL